MTVSPHEILMSSNIPFKLKENLKMTMLTGKSAVLNS